MSHLCAVIIPASVMLSVTNASLDCTTVYLVSSCRVKNWDEICFVPLRRNFEAHSTRYTNTYFVFNAACDDVGHSKSSAG